MGPNATTRPEARRQVRYAVVGLGWVAQSSMLPGFANARSNSTLAALVSDDPEKLGPLSQRYGVRHTFPYDRFEDCLRGGLVDAVYLAVPNHLHRTYAEAAAKAGVHVLCEKPVADTEDDARAIVRACGEAGVRLMVAYRLHLHPAHLRAVELARSGKVGDPRVFSSVFVEPIPEGDVRLKAGGGPLDYIGVYCLNAARSLFGDEPVEALARGAGRGRGRFGEVDEAFSGILTFPGGRLATFTCGFNSPYRADLRLTGTGGDLALERAYAMRGPMTLTVHADGHPSQSTTFPDCDQFGAQLVYFSDCILRGRDPQPSGLEGLADVRVASALRESAETGRPVAIEPVVPPARPDPSDAYALPPSESPDLIKVKAPFSTAG